MNINKFKIDYSKFSDFNIDFSKVYVKSKRICSNNRNKYYQNWYLFTNGETYLALTVDGEITTTVDCRKAYVNRDIIALENFYNKCSFKENFYVSTYRIADDERIHAKNADLAKKEWIRETTSIDEQYDNYVASHSATNKRINFSKTIRAEVLKKSNGRCAICGKPLSLNPAAKDNYATIDHIVPLSRGGKNELKNFQATCRKCNEIKTNIMPEIFKHNCTMVLLDNVLNDDIYQNELFKILIKKKITTIISYIKMAVF